MLYFILALGVVVLVLISLKGWQWFSSQTQQTAKRVVNNDYKSDFRQAWSDADDFVQDAYSWTPYLVGSGKLKTKPNIYFFGGTVTSTILLLFAAAAGWAIGGGNILYAIIAFSVMGIVQIMQAVVSLSGDKGTANLWELKKSDRSIGSWLFLLLLLTVNIVMSVIGSVNVGSQAHQSVEIKTSTLRTDLRTKDSINQQIEMIDQRLISDGQGLSIEALRTKYHAARDEAIRESWRRSPGQTVDERLVKEGKPGPKCGPNCQSYKEEAAKYKALLDDAERKPELQKQLSNLNSRLNQSSGVSAEGVAWANRLESVTGGAIDKDTASKSAWTVFQIIIATLDFALWLFAGDTVAAARRKKYDERAEAANASLEADGYKPRYQRAAKDVAIEPEETAVAEKASSSLEITVSQDAATQIAASEGLQAIEYVFSKLLTQEAGARITRGEIYQIFKAERQAQGVKQHMGQAEFIGYLKRYVELLEYDTQGGQIQGWRVAGQAKVKEKEHAETA